MIEVEVKNLEKYYGSNLIFKNVNFELKSQEKIAIVGKNGCGKSTIMKIIAGIENKNSGEIFIRKNSKIGYLEQIPEFNNYKVKEVLNLAFKDLKEIEDKLRDLELKMQDTDDDIDAILDKYSKLQIEYENLGGYEKDTAISKVCTGLNINDNFLELSFDTLSGGEKTRVMLGKLLIENPDILLLDEPTNHLDMNSVEWLETYLKEYSKSVFIVSHDRYFLDRVVDKVIEIDKSSSKTYLGNYSSYENQKEENLKLEIHTYKEQQKKVHEMEESIKQLKVFSRNGENENFVKRAKSMQKRLEKMEKIDNPDVKKSTMKINITNNTKQSQDVVVIRNGKKSFEDKLLFNNVDMLIRNGEKVCIIGKNGSGKSTLLNIILNKETLDSGELKVSQSSKIGYLPQNVEFEDGEKTILDWFREDITILEGKAREYLAKYMFYQEDVFKKVKSLSGGEKSRLKLSKILYHDINLLILDEPTNHLDIDSINNLEDVLTGFKGSIIFVSHDRYFINKIGDLILEINNETITRYCGNYDYYKREVQKTNLNVDTEKPNIKSKISTNTSKDSKSNKFNKANLEKDIEKLESDIKDIESKMNNEIYDYEILEELEKEKNIIENKLNNLLEEWINMQEV